MKIIFLGTGGSVPTARRDNTSLLLDFKDIFVLIDCPGSLPARLEKSGYRADQLSDIFITHIHPDHVYGLPSFIHVLREREEPLRLYGSAESVDFCVALLRLFNLNREKIWNHLKFYRLEAGKAMSLYSGLTVVAFKVRHHSSSLAFLFKAGDIRILITGDTAPERELLAEIAPGSVLVHDCSFTSGVAENFPSLKNKHTDSLQLGCLAAEVQPRCLIPCHFLDELGVSAKKIEEEIRLNYSGCLVIPEDFQMVEIV